MPKCRIGIFLIGTFCLISQISRGADLHLEVGVHSGGDDLKLTNTTQTGSGLKAGETMSVAIGVVFQPVNAVELQATFGYKYGFDTPLDDFASFLRSELNFLAFYRAGAWRFGGGVTRHQSIRLEASNFTDTTVEFQDASGRILELGFKYNNWGYLGLRYTNIEYVTKPGFNVNNVTVSGNSIGVIAGFRF
jgi:hypothetical protein